jgi:hypothetical protein
MVADRQGGERQDGMNPSELDFRFWHFSSVGCGPPIEPELEVQRTCRELIGRVGLT